MSTGISQRKAKSGVAGKVEALQLELKRHVLVPSTSTSAATARVGNRSSNLFIIELRTNHVLSQHGLPA
jgi:hypothetical protein